MGMTVYSMLSVFLKKGVVSTCNVHIDPPFMKEVIKLFNQLYPIPEVPRNHRLAGATGRKRGTGHWRTVMAKRGSHRRVGRSGQVT